MYTCSISTKESKFSRLERNMMNISTVSNAFFSSLQCTLYKLCFFNDKS